MNTTILGGLASLPAVSLDELNAAAALLTRVDRKYVLRINDLAELWASLPADACALEIDADRSFPYLSTYYDTQTLDSFFDTARPRRRRWKVRTRTYATGDAFLEVKTRRGDATVKERIGWNPHRTTLGTVGYDFVTASLRQAGVLDLPESLTPSLETRYSRSTILLPSEGARVTLDAGLTWTDPTTGASASLGDALVLETKSGSSASSLDRALWSQGHRPARISKYAVGIATLNPELPRNRWHRLMSQLVAA